MKQYPSNLKFKKYHKVSLFYKRGNSSKNFTPQYGRYTIQSAEPSKITFKQIESCRRTIKRGLKKEGILSIKLFTDKPIYKKSLASRMGKGKGNLSHWSAFLRTGQVLFEISGLNFSRASYVLGKSKSKLPLKTNILKIIY